MMYAIAGGNRGRVTATPGARETCPGCFANVIAKCGEINQWHWAHEKGSDCDSWSEPESDWHLGWKEGVRPRNCEVVKPPHRADIVADDDRVIELQHSSIDPETIHERESFYGDMIWVFDAEDFFDRLDFSYDARDFFWFRWKAKRKSILTCRKAVFFDFPQFPSDAEFSMFHVIAFSKQVISKEFLVDMPLLSPSIGRFQITGFGMWLSREEFKKRFMKTVLT